MIRTLLLFGLAWAPTAATAAVPAGHYTSLCYVAEADDYGGMTVELRYKNGVPQIAFELCEGLCRKLSTSKIKTSGDRLTFVATDPEGKDHRSVTYVGRFRGGVLHLSAPGHSEVGGGRLVLLTGKAISHLGPRDCSGN